MRRKKKFKRPRRPIANDVGPYISRMRNRRGLTQDQLAARAQCLDKNLTRQMVANIEARRTRVGDRQIVIIAMVLRCDISDLFPPVSSLQRSRLGSRR
jgi:transcriptional regulator with XRE-family HTH domain